MFVVYVSNFVVYVSDQNTMWMPMPVLIVSVYVLVARTLSDYNYNVYTKCILYSGISVCTEYIST